MSRIDRIEGFRLTSPIDPPRAFSAGVQTSFDDAALERLAVERFTVA
jgi:hypothetical protein